MVASLDRIAECAHGVAANSARENAPADRASWTPPFDGIELIRDLGRHASRQLLAAGGQDVRRETARVLDGGKGVGVLVDASQRQRRLERNRAEGADRQASGPGVVTKRSQDHDPAREAGHHLAEPRSLDHTTKCARIALPAAPDATVCGRTAQFHSQRTPVLGSQNPSNCFRWGTLSISLPRPRATGSRGPLTARPRSRNAAGRRWPPGATSSWPRPPAAARRWPHSCGASTG